MKNLILIFCSFFLQNCQSTDNQPLNNNAKNNAVEASLPPSKIVTDDFINENGKNISTRFNLPKGFERIEHSENSFQSYLRNLPMKPHESKVLHFDGSEKYYQTAAAGVVDIDVGKRDLQQCADAVMRLRAEFLWKAKQYKDIHFNFTNGFNANYEKWRKGFRIKVNGNNVTWQKTAFESTDYQSFRKYLTQVFIYAGTLSLEQELKPINVTELQIGDVFIQGGSPGHAVIVVDTAKNKKTGEIIFLLAQSYMPAQDIHVLTNPENQNNNPWYSINFGKDLETPEWNFSNKNLRRF